MEIPKESVTINNDGTIVVTRGVSVSFIGKPEDMQPKDREEFAKLIDVVRGQVTDRYKEIIAGELIKDILDIAQQHNIVDLEFDDVGNDIDKILFSLGFPHRKVKLNIGW